MTPSNMVLGYSTFSGYFFDHSKSICRLLLVQPLQDLMEACLCEPSDCLFHGSQPGMYTQQEMAVQASLLGFIFFIEIL